MKLKELLSVIRDGFGVEVALTSERENRRIVTKTTYLGEKVPEDWENYEVLSVASYLTYKDDAYIYIEIKGI